MGPYIVTSPMDPTSSSLPSALPLPSGNVVHVIAHRFFISSVQIKTIPCSVMGEIVGRDVRLEEGAQGSRTPRSRGELQGPLSPHLRSGKGIGVGRGTDIGCSAGLEL